MIKKLKMFKKSKYKTDDNIKKLDIIKNEIKKKILYNIKNEIYYEFNKNNVILTISIDSFISNNNDTYLKNNINSYLNLIKFFNEETTFYIFGKGMTIFLWTEEINNIYEKLMISNKIKKYNL